jgi:ribonuclease Z
MAPKLTPDNLVQAEGYLMDLDRNWLDESIFPLSHHTGELTLGTHSKKYTPAPAIPSPYQDSRFITDIKAGSRLVFRGETFYKPPPDNDGVVELKTYLGNSLKESTKRVVQVLNGTKTLISEMDDSRKEDRSPGHDVQIITLGTGSAVPNRIRNGTFIPERVLMIVSCNVLRIPGVGNMFLDCGEGSLGSLRRHFSPSEFEEFFKTLRTIYISHLHADHHLGIVGIIRQYVQFQALLPPDQRQPLFVIAPWRLLRSLYEYNEVESIGMEEYVIPFYSFNLIPQHLLPPGVMEQKLDQGMFQGFLSSMNLRSLETCFVPHCPQAYGVAITHNSGWKIVYSGDCRPSGDLVDIGRDATVLIHEATVAETQPQEALDKMHSTTGEAIMIGKRMNAKHILLTHFSQKWTRIPEFVIEWKKHQDEWENYNNVGIAFDHMSVKVEEMWKLPLMYPAWEVLYQDQMEKKSWKKLKKIGKFATKRTADEDADVGAEKRNRKERRLMKAVRTEGAEEGALALAME